jgi:hypothetical protein
MGLVLANGMCVPRANTPNSHLNDFSFTLPRRFLARRGVIKVYLLLDMAGEISVPP